VASKFVIFEMYLKYINFSNNLFKTTMKERLVACKNILIYKLGYQESTLK